MTNTQFYLLLSPAIGSLLLVVLAWLHQNQRISDLRADTNRQFEGVQRQIVEVRGSIDRQLDEVNQQLDEVRGSIDRQLDEVRGSLSTLTSDYRTFYGMEQKLEGRVDELFKRVA